MPTEGSGAAIAASAFTPRDPDWRARVERLFSQAPFLALLGVELLDLQPGRVVTRIPLATRHCQQDGYVHAGVQATLADHSAGAASSSLVSAGTIVLTAEFKITLLRPARGEILLCESEVVKTGRMLSFCRSEVMTLDGTQKLHVASASVTIAHVMR
ncbi:PaaI family thioesterase [Afifella sp. IM 167]|uniref:PaaI family thioesterase n=1 Tax=Afifella sp. IM 167 TaxID=2033586 RepID=UPI001CCBFF66|nr:PaaI family thioesterase [Afifella sp. IM 167]MBZ8133521.1 phenylacetic acid degradation protein PaaI [Afifella sp. IM 167]